MKSTFFSLLPLAALFVGSLAAPAAIQDTAALEVVEKRQISDAYSIVESLYSTVQTYTGNISIFSHTRHLSCPAS